MPKVYKLTETTQQATNYYIVPPLGVAIPKTPDSREVLNGLLQNINTVHLPTGLTDYPLITRKQLNELFPEYTVLEVKVTYLKYSPYIKGDVQPNINLNTIKLFLSLRK